MDTFIEWIFGFMIAVLATMCLLFLLAIPLTIHHYATHVEQPITGKYRGNNKFGPLFYVIHADGWTNEIQPDDFFITYKDTPEL